MKETITVYQCECGAAFDTAVAAIIHEIFNGHAVIAQELTRDEYALWQREHSQP